jgi:hypothetical protein
VIFNLKFHPVTAYESDTGIMKEALDYHQVLFGPEDLLLNNPDFTLSYMGKLKDLIIAFIPHRKSDSNLMPFAIKCLSTNTVCVSESLKKDSKYLLKVMELIGELLISFPPEFKKSPDGMKEALNQLLIFTRNFPKFRTQEENILQFINIIHLYLDSASSELEGNSKFMLQAVNFLVSFVNRCPDNLKNNQEFMLKVIEKINRCFYDCASENLQHDQRALSVLKNLLTHGLVEISRSLKNNQEFVLRAMTIIKHCKEIIRIAGPDLRKNKNFILAAIQAQDEVEQHTRGEDRDEKEFIAGVLQVSLDTLEQASRTITRDANFVRSTIIETLQKKAPGFTPETLRNDCAFMLRAIENNAIAFHYASDSLRQDENFIFEGLRKRPGLLKFVADDIKTKNFLLRAIAIDAKCFKYIAEDLKKDKDFILQAISKNVDVFHYVSDDFKKDRQFILRAIEIDARSLDYAAEHVRNDLDVVREVLRKNGLLEFHYSPSSLRYYFSEIKDFFEMNNSQDVENNPLGILKRLSYTRENILNFFMRVRYREEATVDEGGPSRDLVSRLFSALCTQQNSPLPMKRTIQGKMIPSVGEPSSPGPVDGSTPMPWKEQIQCYRAIGRIFGAVLGNIRNLNICVGTCFDPVVFDLLHVLLQNLHMLRELNLRDFTEVQDIEKIPASLKKALFSIYAEKYLRMPKEGDEGIDSYLRDSQQLQEFCTDYRINEIFIAVMIIAKTLYQCLPSRLLMQTNRTSEGLRRKLEGELSKDMLKNALVYTQRTSNQQFLETWIKETSLEELSVFVWAISGSFTLVPGVKLMICDINDSEPNETKRKLPDFHSCSNLVYIPEYTTYATFKGKMTKALQSIKSGPAFQTI